MSIYHNMEFLGINFSHVTTKNNINYKGKKQVTITPKLKHPKTRCLYRERKSQWAKNPSRPSPPN